MAINSTLQDMITRFYYVDADTYEQGYGLGIRKEEMDAWISAISANTDFCADDEVLDVGCGTGVLSRILLNQGCKLTGLDASELMIKEAKKVLPSHFQSNIRWLVGDTHQEDLFAPMSFDWITARQSICHFYDPLEAFKNWYQWLKPTGKILILEGLWFRQGWDNDDLVDALPISCVQTRATVAYLLQKSGFQIQSNVILDEVNEFFKTPGKSDSLRYAIVASK